MDEPQTIFIISLMAKAFKNNLSVSLSLFPGHFEFTWQQFMIGVQSSLMMFPLNILIVSIFRNTRPWETSCCKRKPEKPIALEQENTSQTRSSQTATANMNIIVTLDSVIKVGDLCFSSTVGSYFLCLHRILKGC